MTGLLSACLLAALLCQGTVLAGTHPRKLGKTIQRQNLECLVAFYCRKYHVSEAWVRAIIKVESDWNSQALSPQGAYGIMQLMPATARRLQVNRAISAENVEGGIKYLAFLKAHFKGDELLATAAYYAGENNIATREAKDLCPNVRAYVIRVINNYVKELS